MNELWRCVACGFEDITALRDGVSERASGTPRAVPAPVAAPDAQTPKVVRWTSGTVVQSDLGGFVAYGDYLTLERENADLRRQLAEAQDFVTAADEQVHLHGMAKERAEIRAETAEADARELWKALRNFQLSKTVHMSGCCCVSCETERKHRAKYGREG